MSPLTNENIDIRIMQLFNGVIDIVSAKRRIERGRERMNHHCKRYNIDPRIMTILETEYERSQDDSTYTMKTVPEIREYIKNVDSQPEEEPGSWTKL